MVNAYVLAKVEAGKDEEVLKEVKKLSGIRGAVPTCGLYDLHVEVAFPTTENLDQFIDRSSAGTIANLWSINQRIIIQVCLHNHFLRRD